MCYISSLENCSQMPFTFTNLSTLKRNVKRNNPKRVPDWGGLAKATSGCDSFLTVFSAALISNFEDVVMSLVMKQTCPFPVPFNYVTLQGMRTELHHYSLPCKDEKKTNKKKQTR